MGFSMMPKISAVILFSVVVASTGMQKMQNDRQRVVQRQSGLAGQSKHSKREGEVTPLTELGYRHIAGLKSDTDMKDFIRRFIQKSHMYILPGREADLNGLVPYYSGTTLVQSLEALKQELNNAPWIGDNLSRDAPLNEEGYHDVAELKNPSSMRRFMERILKDAGQIVEGGTLAGMVPYFDGEIMTQSFTQLETELRSASGAAQTNKSGNITVATSEDVAFNNKSAVNIGILKSEDVGLSNKSVQNTGMPAATAINGTVLGNTSVLKSVEKTPMESAFMLSGPHATEKTIPKEELRNHTKFLFQDEKPADILYDAMESFLVHNQPVDNLDGNPQSMLFAEPQEKELLSMQGVPDLDFGPALPEESTFDYTAPASFLTDSAADDQAAVGDDSYVSPLLSPVVPTDFEEGSPIDEQTVP